MNRNHRIRVAGLVWLVGFGSIGLYLIFSGFNRVSLPTRDVQLTSLTKHPPELEPVKRSIESIQVGERVLAKNPEVYADERASWPEPVWPQWLKVSLEMPLRTNRTWAEDGTVAEVKTDVLEIEMLRPESWLRDQINYVVEESSVPSYQTSEEIQTSGEIQASGEIQVPSPLSSGERVRVRGSSSPSFSSTLKSDQSPPNSALTPLRPIFRDIALTSASLSISDLCLIGLTVDLDLPEMGATGTAIITNIESCPEIQTDVSTGECQVVTATFKHPPTTQVLDVTFDGESQPIGVTNNHLFWSADRGEFLPIGEMSLGERVITYQGDTKRITSKLARPGPEHVYNLEVYGEHVYYVGEQGLLVHNNCTIVLAISDELDSLKSRFGGVDYNDFHAKGLTTDNLREVSDAGDFLLGIDQAVKHSDANRILFGLDGLTLRRTAAQFSERARLTLPNVPGNVTAQELKLVLGQLSSLRTSKKSITFIRHGKEFDYFFDALADQSVSGIIDAQTLGIFHNAIK